MWKKKSTKIVFKNKWMTVYEDDIITPNGNISYTRIREDDHVVIIPFSKPDDIFVIYNYRYIIGKKCLELPAGHIDKNESVIKSAKRELYEETGLKSLNMRNIGWFYLNESKSKSKVFVCYTDAFDMGRKHTDKSEEILVGKMKITNISVTGKRKNQTCSYYYSIILVEKLE